MRPAAAAGHDVSYDGYNQPLNTLPPVLQREVFLKKLDLCSVVYDFTDVTKQVREKEVKREALQDLVDYVNVGSGKFTEEASPAVVRMISRNLFRELPPRRHGDVGGAPEGNELDEEEPQLEPAWTHLSLVYELLLRYIVSSDTDAKVAKQYVNHRFILRFLNLFDSEDPRERDYLKTILHRVYGKFMVHRPFIRKSINHVFYRFVYETERHNGIAELLEILGSIINGFALPLKEEHKLFLQRALIPLHKPKSLPMYHQQLAYCVTQFVEKDCTLACVVIRGLLRYWPVTNSHKEVLFLGELEEILELTHDAEFAVVAEPLLKQLSRCLTSNHFQVGERSLFLWNNEYIVQLLHHNKSIVVPLVVGALEVRFDALFLALSPSPARSLAHVLTCSRPLAAKRGRSLERCRAESVWKRAEDVSEVRGSCSSHFVPRSLCASLTLCLAPVQPRSMDYKLYNSCRDRYKEEMLERRIAEEQRRALYEYLDGVGEAQESGDERKKA